MSLMIYNQSHISSCQLCIATLELQTLGKTVISQGEDYEYNRN